MTPEIRENDVLAQRLQRLQHEVRRIKAVGISVATVLVIFIVLSRIQTHRKVNAEKIVTQDIVLTDSLGRTRARLTVFPEGSGLEVYAASGERRVQLLGRGEEASLNFYLPVTAEGEAASINFFHNDALMSSFRSGPLAARLEMHTARPQRAAILALQNTTASFTLSGAGEKMPKVWLEADDNHACTALGGGADPSAGGSLCFHSPGLPSLELADLAGDRAVMGFPQTADLSTEDSSAATLILKHKSGRKLRIAPH